MTALIFDTETTGSAEPKLIEAAGIMLAASSDGAVDLRVGSTFCDRYNPGEPSTLGALATHHILDEEVQNCPPANTFALPGETVYLIGHNVDYDWRVAGHPEVKRICTLALARNALPQLESHTLGALAYYIIGSPARDMLRGKAHGAAVDCEVTRHVLRGLIRYYRVEGELFTWEALWAASEFARIPRVMPFGKHKGMAIADLPLDYVQWLLGERKRSPESDQDPYLMAALENR